MLIIIINFLWFHSLRRVVLPWGRLGEGIRLVGGRGRGVFIHSKKNDSRGLQSGDQIIMVFIWMLIVIVHVKRTKCHRTILNKHRSLNLGISACNHNLAAKLPRLYDITYDIRLGKET